MTGVDVLTEIRNPYIALVPLLAYSLLFVSMSFFSSSVVFVTSVLVNFYFTAALACLFIGRSDYAAVFVFDKALF